MKQVLNIGLDGDVFVVEDDAYRRLNVFLSRITQRYEAAPSRNDSPEVIERRLASIFQASGKTVITLKDVEDAIKTIGVTDSSAFGSKQDWSNPRDYYQQARKVFRSRYDKKIGGVCGGLGVYFDIDPTLLRIGFLIGLFLGLSPFLYFLLWVILPTADEQDPRFY